MTGCIHFFTEASGPVPVSYYNSNFGDLQKTIRFSGYPHRILQDLLSETCLRAGQEGIPIQVIHNRLDNSLQGVILPSRSAGAFGFDAVDADNPNILEILEGSGLKAVRESLSAARKTFARARALHNEQEKIYISNMDFAAADQLTAQVIHRLLGDKSGTRQGREIHRFFGAATILGNVDYIPEITMDIPRRFFIKGRPGTGKSTFLKRIAAAARRRGCQVELYHCSLDPESLDMVAVRELEFCLLDSTPPHEYFPVREGDQIIDMYQECVTPGTDERCRGELQSLETSYRQLIKEASACLKEAETLSRQFEDSLPKPDPAALEEVRENLMDALFAG